MRTNFKMWKCLGILAGMAITSMLAVGQEFDLSPTFAGHAVALQVTNAEGNELEFAATGPAPANAWTADTRPARRRPAPASRRRFPQPALPNPAALKSLTKWLRKKNAAFVGFFNELRQN